MTNHAQTVLCTSMDFHYHNSQNQLTSYKLFPVQFRLYSQISRRNNAEIRPGSSKNSSRPAEEQTSGPHDPKQRRGETKCTCVLCTRLYTDDAVVAGHSRRARGRRALLGRVVRGVQADGRGLRPPRRRLPPRRLPQGTTASAAPLRLALRSRWIRSGSGWVGSSEGVYGSDSGLEFRV